MRSRSGSFQARRSRATAARRRPSACASRHPRRRPFPPAIAAASAPSTGGVVSTGEQIRTRRCARPIACPILCERSSPWPGVNQTRTPSCHSGSTVPVPPTCRAERAARSRAGTPPRAPGESTTTITFSCRVHASSVQFVEPVQTDSPSRITYLWCIRSGTPAIGNASTGSAVDQRLVGRRRRRDRDRPRVVDVVGEPDVNAARRRHGGSRRPRRGRLRARGRSRTAPGRVSAGRRRGTPAIAAATSGAVWPPSVRVRIVMRGFIERLVAARIGGTFNFYRDGDRAAAAARAARGYLEGASRRAGAARRRGAGLPGHAGLRRPAHLRAPAHRHRAGRGDRDDRARALDELGLAGDVLLWNVVPTHPGDERSNRRPTPGRDRGRARRSRASSRAAGGSSPVGRIAHAALGGATSGTRLHGGAAVPRGLEARTPGSTWYHRPPADEVCRSSMTFR